MRIITITVVAALLSSAIPACTQTKDRQFMDRGQVRHGKDSATVLANSPRALDQAVRAVSEEYGWIVDYEDPPYYSQYDLYDATAPAWRAQHPNAKGVLGIHGGPFQSQYHEDAETRSSGTQEQEILKKLVSDYHQSGNPGRFSVRREGPERISITGIAVTDEDRTLRDFPPILDTPVSIASETRDGMTAVNLIVSTLDAAGGRRIRPGILPTNRMLQSKVSCGGQNLPARILLQQVLDAIGRKLYWTLYYDPSEKAYYLNVALVHKAQHDALGNRTTAWVK